MEEKFYREVVEWLKQQIDLLTGNTTYGDTVVTASGAVATYEGNAKRIVLLKDTTFNHCYIDDVDVATQKGYNVAITAPAVLCPGKGKKFTGFEIADGGQVQVIE